MTGPATAPALELRQLAKRFGGVLAADAVSLALPAGARHALIGPNGAGKTTLVNLIAGALRPSAGRVLVHGRDVTGLAAHERVGHGLARTFQINQLFAGLTPLQSTALAVARRRGVAGRWWRPLGRQGAVVDEAFALLERAGLADDADRPTGTLAYGRQRQLEIALALALEPRVLLLDEPAAGVSPGEGAALVELLLGLPRTITMLLIEHDMDLVFRFAERVSVLVDGAVLADGPPAAIAADPLVRAAYLGAPDPDG